MEPPFFPSLYNLLCRHNSSIDLCMKDKASIRTELLARRLSLKKEDLQLMQSSMLEHFKRVLLPELESVHYYRPLAKRNEPDPSSMVKWLTDQQPKLVTAVPLIVGTNDMVHIQVNDETQWVPGPFGIAEPQSGDQIDPAAFDLVFVPLLGFDKSGNRIGYGKGFYDKFLSECRINAIKIGLSFLDTIDLSFEPDPWDIRLDYVITPDKLYKFD